MAMSPEDTYNYHKTMYETGNYSNNAKVDGVNIVKWLEKNNPYNSTDSSDSTSTKSTSTTPTSSTPTTTTTTDTYKTPTVGEGDINQVTASKPESETQINIADYGGQVAIDPIKAFSEDMLLSGQTPEITDEDIKAGELTGGYETSDADKFNADVATVEDTATANYIDPRDAVTYEAATSFDKVDAGVADVTAAQGELSDGAIIDEDDIGIIDVEGHAKGDTELGKALKDFAFLDPDNVDARATVKGQIDVLQEEFVDEDGNPTIPPWASAAARNVAKMAAFQGVTGTAAVAAMSQAIMESSIQIAEQDAKFFQTLTLTNLSNEQQAFIQRASILANMEMENADARTVAAIQNSKNFLAMDLQNLTNEQQANVINGQQRFQSLMTDTAAENAARIFGAEAQNELNKFYDALNADIEKFNAAQLNLMEQFNAGETNAINQFNSTLMDSRDKYDRDMQYVIDRDNAQWRQELTTMDKQMEFEAAAFDVSNLVGMSTEQLNRLWNRADSILDYAWKSAENDADRDAAYIIEQMRTETQLAIAKIDAKTRKSIQDKSLEAQDEAGKGKIISTIIGEAAASIFS